MLNSMYLQRQRLLNSVKFINLAICEINDSEYIDACEQLNNVIKKLEKDIGLWNKQILMPNEFMGL